MEKLIEVHHDSAHFPQKGRPLSDLSNPLWLTARHFPNFIPPSAGKERLTRCCKLCCSQTGTDGKKTLQGDNILLSIERVMSCPVL